MSHTERDQDGMKVTVVTDMNRRYDEDGNLKSSTVLETPLELVHASEIAKYYGLPLRSTGRGDNEVPGVWAMVYANEFGLRVPYNGEASRRGNRNVRVWTILKDANGNPLDTKEEIKRFDVHHEGIKRTAIPLLDELDDGMYVKLADLLEYASAQGWQKGKGRLVPGAPVADTKSADDKLDKLTDLVTGLAQIMAQQAVMTANPLREVPHQPVKK